MTPLVYIGDILSFPFRMFRILSSFSTLPYT
jgi:hypothetical protein